MTNHPLTTRNVWQSKAQWPQGLREAAALQEIECNPLSAEQIAMFEDFEARGLSHEERRAEIQKWAFQKYGAIQHS